MFCKSVMKRGVKMAKVFKMLLFFIILVFQLEVWLSQVHSAFANFRGNRTAKTAPLMVNFSGQSDGSSIYNDPGSYAVRLAARGQKVSDTETKPDHITAANPPLEQDRSVSGSVPTTSARLSR